MAKGQVWSYDLLVAVTVFMFTIGLITFFWWNVAAASGERPGDTLTEATGDFADVLLSPGNPSDWEDFVDTGNESTWNVSILGMGEAFGSPRISEDKALALREMNATNYPALKARFRSNYNFYVEMKEFYNCSVPSIVNSPINCTDRGIPPDSEEWNSSGHFVSIGGTNFTLGIPPNDAGARSVSVANRFAVYDGSLVRVRVVLWTNQSWQ